MSTSQVTFVPSWLSLYASETLSTLKFVCHDFWENYGDPRLSKLPLLYSGPWHVLTLIGLYLYFVKVWGPRFMKNRQPYDLRVVMIIHNAFLVLLNGVGLLIALAGANFALATFECRRFDPNSGPKSDILLLYLGYTYYVSKYIDFLDTIYFVLRKKDSHVSGLHVFHHSMMPFWCYIFFKFSPYTNNGFIPTVNAFVHTIMYSYYALTALGPHMQKYLWWKKWITILQLVQFVACTSHSLYFFLDPTCQIPKVFLACQVLHGFLFLHLFYSFYKKTYHKKQIQANDSKAYTNGKVHSSNGVKNGSITNGKVTNGSVYHNGSNGASHTNEKAVPNGKKSE